MTAALRLLDDELHRWADAGRIARLWLRDDDAVAASPALDDLLATLRRHRAPVLIAAIPARLEASLAPRLSGLCDVAVGVHGHAHVNHAAAGVKKSEYPASRDRSTVRDELARGLADIRNAFGDMALPVFVPPWNRAYAGIARDLVASGYRALSTFADAHVGDDGEDIVVANAHVDVMFSPGARGGRRPDIVAGEVATMLACARTRTGRDHPVGILTHHLVHDADARETLDTLLGHLANHAAVRFLHPREVIAGADSASR